MSGKERGFALRLATDAVAAFFMLSFVAFLLWPLWLNPKLVTRTHVAAFVAFLVIFPFALSWLQIRYTKTLHARFPIVENRRFRLALLVTICSLAPLSQLLRDLFVD